jgi:hypothetical protein
MSTAPAELRRRVCAAAAALALVVGLASCSGDEVAPGESASRHTPEAGGPSAVEIPPDLERSFSRLLRQRAAALLSGDRVAFADGLELSDDSFVAQQAAYFDNLRHLPIAELGFDLDIGTLVRSGDDYWGVVDVALQLDGFDAEPVVSVDRYRFSPVGEGGRRFALSSVTDAEWEADNGVFSQPWDDGPIEVRAGAGVLGIFDVGSVAAAPRLVRSVERGISDVAGIVPYDWSRSVVVYALSDTDFLSSIEDPPGGHPERLDGVAFPVMTGPTSGEVASTRFVLNPRVLDRARLERDRLVRHELAHVAIGEHDDHAPVWLSEGLAEYVSVRPLAPEDRRIADAAIAAARGRLITELPDDATFNDGDSALNYGVAWWACEYLATAFGEASLWTILDELDDAGTDPEDGSRLAGLTGINSRTLARKAAKQMLATFDPGYRVTPGPSANPSGEPSADAGTSDVPDPQGE